MSKSKIDKYYISTLPRQQDRTEENLKLLRLSGIPNFYQKLAQEALKNSWIPIELIERLLQAEINWKENNRIDRWLKQAGFEAQKTLVDFDFSYPKKINKVLIFELASCRFIEEAKNVVFLGQTGVGKTHLATALGIESINKGFEARFLTLRRLGDLIDKIKDSAYELNKLKISLVKPKLLILDEIALNQSTDTLAKFLAELILDRHLKSSTIFTSNKTPRNWVHAFGDKYTTTMAIDRIFEKAEVVNIEGESYRIRDRIQNEQIILDQAA